ncbi:MAG: MBL fold metallo-hydrolase [Deltaproteobacteria bacterium]|nr:MBL fold metallo-hydrolase [Deltaproteobacteria bacterium]MBI3077309.1 MBL fold metallo-hydrolase [Deltaproteobacteria bacterium]
MAMEVIAIGTGTAIPSARRGAPCLLVRVGGAQVLFDCGAGSLRTLAGLGVSPLAITHLYFTHLHPDHTGDLVPLLFALRNPDWRREAPLRVTGPVGFLSFFGHLEAAYGHWVAPSSYELAVDEWAGGIRAFGAWQLRAAPVRHLAHSLAYRVEAEGRAVAFTGDTDYCASIVELARGADLLVSECSFPEGMKVEGHLTPSLAGRIAAEAGCPRLLLTHFYPPCDATEILEPCRQVFAGEVQVAEDGTRVVLD